MAYYGLEENACWVYHLRKIKPFLGGYWCPVCEKLRQLRKEPKHPDLDEED